MWRSKPKYKETDPDSFDETEHTSATQLETYASAILWHDPERKEQSILFDEHLATRRKKELSVDPLKIDPAFSRAVEESPAKTAGDGLGMYWRSHREGRKVNSKEQRSSNGAGYYRG